MTTRPIPRANRIAQQRPNRPTPSHARRDSSMWDDPLGADLSAGKADELEDEGKDPASCITCDNKTQRGDGDAMSVEEATDAVSQGVEPSKIHTMDLTDDDDEPITRVADPLDSQGSPMPVVPDHGGILGDLGLGGLKDDDSDSD